MMTAQAWGTRRFGRRIPGYALHAAIYGLPMGIAILLLNRLAGTGFASSWAGPIIFIVLFSLAAILIEAMAGRRLPRLFPMQLGEICFDDALSIHEKFERLVVDRNSCAHLLAQLVTLSLLTLALLATR